MQNKLYNLQERPNKELITTQDGTQTLYSKEFDECYHSTKDGALKESLNKHIIPAFKLQNKGSLVVLDICYGLGYNTLTTIYYYQKHRPNTKLHIIAPEFDKELVESLKDFNYPKEFNNLKDIINAISKTGSYTSNNLKVTILFGDAREQIKNIDTKVDIIYQDAFSPKKNPALWTKEWFADIKKISKADAIITTYSVATPIRLSMYENGFKIYTQPKTEVRSGTIASLKDLNLEQVDMKLKKIRNKSAKPLSDKDLAS